MTERMAKTCNFASMKRMILITLLTAMSTTLMAQRIGRGPLHSDDYPRYEWLLPGDTLYDAQQYGAQPRIYQGRPQRLAASDSIATPQTPLMPTYAWNMHQGLNLSVDLSAFATLGKHAPHRGGFGQTINAAYLAPLTRDGKLWGAGGIYVNNTTWGGDSFHDVGLYGILGYRPNDKWEFYLYGQLSVTNNYTSLYGLYSPWYGYYSPYALPSMMNMGYGLAAPGANVIGFGAKYNFSPSFSVGISVQGTWYDAKRTPWPDRHEYPIRPER